MMRLNEPERNFETTLDECIKGITGNENLKSRMMESKPDLILAGKSYITYGKTEKLYTIPPIPSTNDNPIVVGTLVKSELVKLYEYYFRNEEKESRTTYDKLLNSAHEQCPFCGGIGTPRNLDHFLPKAHFPQFSTFPQNLVPSCRDCNMDGKAQSFATRAENQLLQPYVDHDRFFKMKWISAKCILAPSNRPTSIQYYVDAPQEWQQVYKDRVRKHFDDFELAKRFSVKAAQLLETTLGQIDGLKNLNLPNATIRTVLLTPGINNAPFINHWQRGMFQALYDHLL